VHLSQELLLIQKSKAVEPFKGISIILVALVRFAMTVLKLDYIIQRGMEAELIELLFISWVEAGVLALIIHQFLITVTCVLLQMLAQHLLQSQVHGLTLWII
jgi:hypothetical protein